MPTASQWTLEELSNALQSPTTDPAIVPYLEDALNAMMDALFNGQHIVSRYLNERKPALHQRKKFKNK